MNMISSPPHYTAGRKYETIEVLEAYFPKEPLLWQVGKYVSRAGRKGDAKQDIGKALWYLDRFISEGRTAAYIRITTDMNPKEVISDWYDNQISEIALAAWWLLKAPIETKSDIQVFALQKCREHLDRYITENERLVYKATTTSAAVDAVENLSFSEYETLAYSTAVYPNGAALYYPALGLCGEAGEVAEKVKKLFRDHDGVLTEEYKTKIVSEVGDVLWYVAALCRDLGVSMEDCAYANMAKLQDRQARGVIKGSGDER